MVTGGSFTVKTVSLTWFAQGVGPVKIHSEVETSGVKYRYEYSLKEYPIRP